MSKPFPDVPIPEAHKAGAERARRMFVSVPMTEGEKLPDPDPEDTERGKRSLFAACGMRGKLWEEKP